MAENDGIDDMSSEESFGSSCSSNSEYDILWLDHVGARGDLFYIEADLGSVEDEALRKDVYIDGTHFETTKPKLNTAQKFKTWIKKRNKRIPKSVRLPLFKSKEESDDSEDSMYDGPYPVVSKDIFIDVKPEKEYEEGLIAAKELFGIELGYNLRGLNKKMQIIGFTNDEEISGIQIGDYLISVDDVKLSINTVDRIFCGITAPSRVKLTFLSPSAEENNKDQKVFHLIKELLGDQKALDEVKSQFKHMHHGLFYFSMNDEESENNENDGIIYKYPEAKSLLLQLKGMFITVALMIEDIVSPPVLSCSVKIDEEILHVGFWKEGDELMLLVLPAICATVAEVQHFTIALAKLFKFQFQSLKNAFTIGNDEKRMDQFCILYFRHCLSNNHRQKGWKSHFKEIIPGVQWLPVPSEISTEVDDVLSELESCDFQPSSDGFFGNQRIYSIIGSCLYFKGYLINNHLSKSDLLDVHSFLHHHHIFDLTKMSFVSDVIIWQEVFPNITSNSSDGEYVRHRGRSILLVAALHHTVLATLLEDGGCAMKAETIINPEPFFVEEVQNTLKILQDCGLIAAVDRVFPSCFPPVSSPDSYFNDYNSGKRLSQLFSPNATHNPVPSATAHCMDHQLNSSLEKEGKKISPIDILEETNSERQMLISSMGPADGESDDKSSYSGTSEENFPINKRKRRYSISTGSTVESQESDEYILNQTPGKNFSSIPQISAKILSLETSQSLLSGSGTTLFHYVDFNSHEGIYLAPSEEDRILLTESNKNGVLRAFHACCENMRSLFTQSVRSKENLKSANNTQRGHHNFSNSSYEQVVMFEYTARKHSKTKNSKTFTFWVSGRLFFEPHIRELYVCYHDATPRDLVEIAHRLGFGCLI